MIVSRSDESVTIANGMVAGTVPCYRHHRFRRRRNSTENRLIDVLPIQRNRNSYSAMKGLKLSPSIPLTAQFLIALHDQSHYSCQSILHFSLLDRDKTATQISPLAERCVLICESVGEWVALCRFKNTCEQAIRRMGKLGHLAGASAAVCFAADRHDCCGM